MFTSYKPQQFTRYPTTIVPDLSAGFDTPEATIQLLGASDSASVTVTATGPNTAKKFQFSFKLPKGYDGAAGDFAQPVATAQQLAQDQQPTVQVTSSGPASAKVFSFEFGIPKGATGAAGPANTLTIGTVTAGDTASATITGTSPQQVLNLVLPKGDKGDTGQAGADGASAYQVWINDGNAGTQTDFLDSLKATGYRHPFTAADITNDTLTITTTGTPVSISDQESITYPLQFASYRVTGTQVTIDMAVNLSAIGKGVSGTWYVNFAAGGTGTQPSGTYITELTGASFTPAANNIYKHTVVQGQSISFESTNMSAGRCSTFELWLIMGAAVVSFSLPDTLTWVGTAPSFDSANMLYALVVRWDGQSFVANLAYTKSVA